MSKLIDISPTFDDELNLRRQAAIDHLGRQLRPEESLRIEAGDDYTEVPLVSIQLPVPQEPGPLSPEQALAAAQNVSP